MEFSLIHDNSLILGPMGYNYRMINFDLEDLEVEERVGSQSYNEIPIHFSDGLTHLLPIEKDIPEHDARYSNVGNFTWEIVRDEDDVPTKVLFTYPIADKTLEEVKQIRKQEVSPVRKAKENTIINLNINGTEVQVPTTREERVILSSKLAVSSATYNYKFLNTWLEVTSENLQTVIDEIDAVVQTAYDWELAKLQEIDACETIDDVYAVVLVEETVNENNPERRNPRNQSEE